jgi:hypothetical protein
MANLKSLQEVANTAPGSYVSGGFQAVVSKVKERTAKATGKKFYACSITEGNLTIAALCDRDVTALEGKLVKFMGMGIKRGNDYNGVAQVNIGDKTTILPVGDGVIAVPLTTSQQPVQYINSPAEAAPVSRIEGVTVGMAINKAVDICTKTGDVSEETLWYWSSILIRMAQKLQAGNLAPVPETKPELEDEQPY